MNGMFMSMSMLYHIFFDGFRPQTSNTSIYNDVHRTNVNIFVFCYHRNINVDDCEGDIDTRRHTRVILFMPLECAEFFGKDYDRHRQFLWMNVKSYEVGMVHTDRKSIVDACGSKRRNDEISHGN